MTLRARRTAFYLLVVLFLIAGTAIVFYAQGWRFNFGTWRAERVGAVLVRPYPAGAAIALGGKPVANQANFFSQSTLISGLLPGNYSLSLRATGYDDWNENATVLSSLVTEFKYAVLVPAAPSSVTTTSVAQFASASTGGTVMETDTGAIVIGGTTTTIARGSIVSASKDLNTIVYKEAGGPYAWYDAAAATTTNLSTPFVRAGVNMRMITGITVDPYDAGAIVVQNAERIWIFRTGQAATMLIDRAASGATFPPPLASSPSLLAWTQFEEAADTSGVVLYDKGAKTLAGSSSTLPGRTLELQWINGSLLGALQSDGSLYTYDTNARSFQKIADNVKQFAVAGDGSAVAALEYNSFEVFPFANTQTYHRFNLPEVAAAMEVIWYRDAGHLFVVYPNSVSFLDLQDAGLRNLTTVAKGMNPIYNSDRNIFYLINSAQKLEEFDFSS